MANDENDVRFHRWLENICRNLNAIAENEYIVPASFDYQKSMLLIGSTSEINLRGRNKCCTHRINKGGNHVRFSGTLLFRESIGMEMDAGHILHLNQQEKYVAEKIYSKIVKSI